MTMEMDWQRITPMVTTCRGGRQVGGSVNLVANGGQKVRTEHLNSVNMKELSSTVFVGVQTFSF